MLQGRSPLIDALVALLVTSPRLEDVLSEHRAVHGRCACCKVGGDGSARALSPCTIRSAAESAWKLQRTASAR